MKKILNNIFQAQFPQKGERFESLLEGKGFLIERILSGDVITPKKFCQERAEWVVLLKGEALLEMEGEKFEFKEGDFLFIPPKTPHTLLKILPGSLWLAFHFDPKVCKLS